MGLEWGYIHLSNVLVCKLMSLCGPFWLFGCAGQSPNGGKAGSDSIEFKRCVPRRNIHHDQTVALVEVPAHRGANVCRWIGFRRFAQSDGNVKVLHQAMSQETLSKNRVL